MWVLDQDGNHLGTIVHGQNATTNLAFGDEDWKTLYITTWNTLCRVRVNIPGVPVPVKKQTLPSLFCTTAGRSEPGLFNFVDPDFSIVI